MKKMVFSSFVFIVTFLSCNNTSTLKVSISEDSIKKQILEINAKMVSVKKENPNDSKLYESLCEDSLLSLYDQNFMTSSSEMSHDLVSGLIVEPHDFTFRIYEKTVILSFLSTNYEIVNGDTIFHNIRTMKTFVLDNNTWKLASVNFSLQGKNFTKPCLNQPNNYVGIPGIYKWSESKEDSFFVKDGKLYDVFERQPPTLNFAIDDSTYIVNNDFGKIHFNKNKQGIVYGYTYTRYDGQSFKVPKIR